MHKLQELINNAGTAIQSNIQKVTDNMIASDLESQVGQKVFKYPRTVHGIAIEKLFGNKVYSFLRSKLPGSFYVDVTKMTPEAKDRIAEVFAEDSKELKQLLLLLWDNGIETASACSGIETNTEHIRANDTRIGRPPSPILGIRLTNGNKEDMANMISNFSSEELEKYEIGTRSARSAMGELTFAPNISGEFNEEQSDEFFKNLKHSITHARATKKENTEKSFVSRSLSHVIKSFDPSYKLANSFYGLTVNNNEGVLRVFDANRGKRPTAQVKMKEDDYKMFPAFVEAAISAYAQMLNSGAEKL